MFLTSESFVLRLHAHLQSCDAVCQPLNLQGCHTIFQVFQGCHTILQVLQGCHTLFEANGFRFAFVGETIQLSNDLLFGGPPLLLPCLRHLDKQLPRAMSQIHGRWANMAKSCGQSTMHVTPQD